MLSLPQSRHIYTCLIITCSILGQILGGVNSQNGQVLAIATPHRHVYKRDYDSYFSISRASRDPCRYHSKLATQPTISRGAEFGQADAFSSIWSSRRPDPSRVASPLGRPYRHRVHWSGRRARIWPIPNGSRSNGLYRRRLRQFSGRDPRCNPLSYLSSPQIQLIRSLPCAN